MAKKKNQEMGNFNNELKNWQQIPKLLINDSSLSDRARFVYCFMACKAEDWDFFMQPLAKDLGYSVDTLKKYINELIESGWLSKGEQTRNSDNTWGSTKYTLHAQKVQRVSDTENFRHGENTTQYNTDIDIKSYIDKKEDTNVSKKDKDLLFEECWKLYNRKGSKGKSKPYWDKLTIEEMQLAKSHIQAYVQSVSERKYQKDFERYLRDKIFKDVVYKGNMIIFDPERENDTDNEYRPQLDGFNLHWNEQVKCYISMYDIDMLFDGYTSENRPPSAMVMKGGIRYKWNTQTKKWEVQ